MPHLSRGTQMGRQHSDFALQLVPLEFPRKFHLPELSRSYLWIYQARGVPTYSLALLGVFLPCRVRGRSDRPLCTARC